MTCYDQMSFCIHFKRQKECEKPKSVQDDGSALTLRIYTPPGIVLKQVYVYLV